MRLQIMGAIQAESCSGRAAWLAAPVPLNEPRGGEEAEEAARPRVPRPAVQLVHVRPAEADPPIAGSPARLA